MNEKQQFIESGLLFLVNQLLHCFGWALIASIDDETNEVKSFTPKKVEYFGFDKAGVQKHIDRFKKLTEKN
jgi:hypothetical protein